MTWTVDWDADICTATHARTGATFKAAKSGWIGCIDPGTASDAELRGLMSEVVVMLRLSDGAADVDDRLLH